MPDVRKQVRKEPAGFFDIERWATSRDQVVIELFSHGKEAYSRQKDLRTGINSGSKAEDDALFLITKVYQMMKTF